MNARHMVLLCCALLFLPVSFAAGEDSGSPLNTSDAAEQLPRAGTALPFPAPVPKTGQTTSYGYYDDGVTQIGVAWPNPRFTNNNDGTVTDNLTGLVWLRNANCFGTKNWADALAAVNGLSSGSCGLSDISHAGDWRMPNINELSSLVDPGQYNPALPSGHPFLGVQTYVGGAVYYHSSTTTAIDTTGNWGVNFQNGLTTGCGKGSIYVWPVKDTWSFFSKTFPAPVAKTGQSVSYGPHDDGDLQKGVAWPNPRFTDNYNGTVTDNLTGLIWLKNANCYGLQSWALNLVSVHGLSKGICGLTDGSNVGDWRIPNINEIRSLQDAAHFGPALPAGHPFTNLASGLGAEYCSSDTYTSSTGYIMSYFMNYGSLMNWNDKTGGYYVWPVRSGQGGSSAKTTYDFVWSGPGGSAGIWTLDSSNNVSAYKQYGP
ncbi:MAG: DUF1566 domain-containing protein, partial [Deltaproteobacteria bacterium]|nr:DUF1566 domain-containing protein [Deltaproteobacteria bacterium]